MLDLRNELGIDAPRCKGMNLEHAPNTIWTQPGWVLEPKIDGIRVTLQIGKTQSMLIGRNRQDFLKGVAKAGRFRDLSDLNPRISAIGDEVLEGTMLDGELTECINMDGSYDKETLERRVMGDFVGYQTWGVLTWKGEDVRYLTEEERYDRMKEVVHRLKMFYPDIPIQAVERFPATKDSLERLWMSYEGAVAKRLDSSIPPRQRTNPNWFKLKSSEHRTVDAFVIGVTQGKEGGSGITGVRPVPNGKAASLIMGMYTEDGVVEVGKMANLPKEEVEEAWKNPYKFQNRVVEMMTSGWNGKAFRFPRFVKYRWDKGPKDCVLTEQLAEV